MENTEEKKTIQIIEMDSYRRESENIQQTQENIISNLSACIDMSFLQAELVLRESVDKIPTFDFQEKLSVVQNCVEVLAHLNATGKKEALVRRFLRDLVEVGTQEMTNSQRGRKLGAKKRNS